MSTNTDPRPSLAELRARARHKCRQHSEDNRFRLPCHFTQIDNRDLLPLIDIAEAAQAMYETADRSGENADIWFEGDRMEATEQALKGVRP